MTNKPKKEITDKENYCRDGLFDVRLTTNASNKIFGYARIRNAFRTKTSNKLLDDSDKSVKTEFGFRMVPDDAYHFLGNFSNEGDFNFTASNISGRRARGKTDRVIYASIMKDIYDEVPRVDLGFLAHYNEILFSVRSKALYSGFPNSLVSLQAPEPSLTPNFGSPRSESKKHSIGVSEEKPNYRGTPARV